MAHIKHRRRTCATEADDAAIPVLVLLPWGLGLTGVGIGWLAVRRRPPR